MIYNVLSGKIMMDPDADDKERLNHLQERLEALERSIARLSEYVQGCNRELGNIIKKIKNV